MPRIRFRPPLSPDDKKITMNHIRAIQEAVDENKQSIPTEVARAVMKNTQGLYDIHANLYKLTWTTVDAHAHVEHVEDEEDFAHVNLVPKTQTLIVEAVEHPPNYPGSQCKMDSIDMPHHGMVLASWLELSRPNVVKNPRSPSELVVIHSIEPYEPKKRARVM